jgi:hypothetical protein
LICYSYKKLLINFYILKQIFTCCEANNKLNQIQCRERRMWIFLSSGMTNWQWWFLEDAATHHQSISISTGNLARNFLCFNVQCFSTFQDTLHFFFDISDNVIIKKNSEFLLGLFIYTIFLDSLYVSRGYRKREGPCALNLFLINLDL